MVTQREAATTSEPYRIGTLGRHSVIYGLGMILSKAVAIVMLPIYTRWLTPADYGVLALITMTFEVVTIFAGSRIAVGVFRFYHKAEGDRGRQDVISTAFLLLGLMYVVAAVITVYLAPGIARVVFGDNGLNVTLVRLAATSMAFEGLILVPIALFQLEERSKLFVLVSLARLTIQVLANLIFLIPLQMGVAGVLWGSVVTHALVGTALSVGLIRKVGVRFSGRAAKEYLRFGLPLVVMQVATFIATFGDRYFLARAADTTEVGLYSLAYQFGFLVITLGFVPFQQIWEPQRFAIAKRADRDTIYARVFIYVSILVVSVALGIALFGGDVLRIIAAPAFHSASVYIPVLAAAYVLQSWSFFLNLGIYVTERTEYFTLANWISALVALAGYLWLIPIWFAWGATIATLASIAVRCWLAHVFSQRLWPVKYEWGPVVRLSVLGVAVGTVSAVMPSAPLILSILLHSAFFGVYLAILWVLPILTRDERETIRSSVVQWRALFGAA